MLNNLMWVVTLAAICGALLNARQKVSGFYVWIVTNTCLVAYNVYQTQYAQAVLFLVYTGISVVGIISWRKQNG